MIYGFKYNTLLVTPVVSTALVSVEAVKAALGITGSDHDAWVTSAIAVGSGTIVGYCKREFALAELKDRFRLEDPAGRPVGGLYLSRWPLNELVAITEGGQALDKDNDIESNIDMSILWRRSAGEPVAWAPSCLIEIHHKSGYELPDKAPPEVQAACIELCKAAWFGKDMPAGVRSIDMPDVGGISLGAVTGANGEASAAFAPVLGPLEPYRNWAKR